MFKKLIVALAAFIAATAFAAVDANKATQAELESIKGIGPAISGAIIAERKKGDFKDWNDLVVRVKGVGETNAAKFSSEGLTVQGKTFSGAAPAAAKPATTAKAEPAKAEAAKAEAAKTEPANAETAKAEKTEKTDKTKAEKSTKAEKAEAKTAAASAPKK